MVMTLKQWNSRLWKLSDQPNLKNVQSFQSNVDVLFTVFVELYGIPQSITE